MTNNETSSNFFLSLEQINAYENGFKEQIAKIDGLIDVCISRNIKYDFLYEQRNRLLISLEMFRTFGMTGKIIIPS